MSRHGSFVGCIGRTVGFTVALGATYFGVVRPWHTNWGATEEEIAMALPGDDLIPDPQYVSNHAVTIDAPIADVWPWLAQIGYGRAGWYSYDGLHRAMGVAGSVDDPQRSATRIIPELQDLHVGDHIRFQPSEEPSFVVIAVGAPHTMLLGSGRDGFEVSPEMGGLTWAWVLREVDAHTTRFIVRSRNIYSSNPVVRALFRVVIDPGGFLMERRTMLNIKARAEGRLPAGTDAGQTGASCCG